MPATTKKSERVKASGRTKDRKRHSSRRVVETPSPSTDDDDDNDDDSDQLDSDEPRKKRRVGSDESGDSDADSDEEDVSEAEGSGEDASASEGDDDESGESGSEISENDDDDDNDNDNDEEQLKRIIKPTETPVSATFSAPSRIRRKAPGAAKTTTPTTTTTAPPAEQQPPPATAGPVTDPHTTFDALGLRPWLVQSLANMAIRRPTAIQKGCIPAILRGHDCIGGSRTGSGKTVAFAVPILQAWAADPSAIFALVLTPTRELALQIYEQFMALSAPQPLKAVLITGGADMRAQAIALAKRPHLVIATPGRLADHIRTSGEDTYGGLGRVRYVVLDEADRLLAAGGGVGGEGDEDGEETSDKKSDKKKKKSKPATNGSMLPDVETCLGVLPPPTRRQTLLFTATVTPEVRALKTMRQEEAARTRASNAAAPANSRLPVFVCEVETQAPAVPATLRQMHLMVPVTHREHYLQAFLTTAGNEAAGAVIVFVNRAATAAYLHHLLRLLGHRVTALYAGLPQRQRTDNLGRFRAAAARILVATDVAARGLDIPEVQLVVNYDVPRNPDDYIHRVGRTARAGRTGTAVTFVGQRDVALVLAIEQRVGRALEAWAEEGVNLDTRVAKEALKLVGEKKREALLEIEENREVGGKRKRGMQKLRPTM